jgi:hypothetical protein
MMMSMSRNTTKACNNNNNNNNRERGVSQVSVFLQDRLRSSQVSQRVRLQAVQKVGGGGRVRKYGEEGGRGGECKQRCRKT